MAYSPARHREYRKENIDRIRANHQAWYLKNREAISKRKRTDEVRMYERARRFNVTLEELQAILDEGCKLCGSFVELHIDHDHTCCPGVKSCGRCVRGALCGPHNRGLGQFKDDVAMLAKAIEYLGS